MENTGCSSLYLLRRARHLGRIQHKEKRLCLHKHSSEISCRLSGFFTLTDVETSPTLVPTYTCLYNTSVRDLATRQGYK